MLKTCVFPVGGIGTRFLPATKSIPKEMLSVLNKPLIQYAVEEARLSGIERFIFITAYGKTAIEDHFDRNATLCDFLERRGSYTLLEEIKSVEIASGEAVFIRQSEPLGLGHALLCAQNFIQESEFAVILADDLILSDQPCLKQMMDAHRPGTHQVGVMNVAPSETYRYGILGPMHSMDTAQERSLLSRASFVVEKPSIEEAPSTTAIIGRYILNKRIFDALKIQKPGQGNEIQLTDAIQTLIEEIHLYGFFFTGSRYDCGSPSGWLEANIACAMRDPELRDAVRNSLQ